METTTAVQEIPVPAKRTFYDLKPRGKWVLIRMVPREERHSEGGIVVSTAQAKTQHGIVVGFDPDEVKRLHVGQHCVFTNFVTDLEDVEELTGKRNLFLVRDEEVYSGCEEITDPVRIAEIEAEIEARYGNAKTHEAIDEEYKKATGKE